MSRPRRLVLTAALGAAALVLEPTSRAHADTARIGALRAATLTPVEVASEEVTLECTERGEPAALACALRVEWTLHNPTDAAQTPQVVLSWSREEEAELRVGGALVDELPTLRPVTAIVPAGGSAQLELRATVVLEREHASGPMGIATPLTPLDPIHARHPLLARPWISVRRGLAWTRPDDLRFGAVGSTRIEVRVPEGWHGGADLEETGADGVFRYRSPQGRAVRTVNVELTRGSQGDFLRNGGPFLALGGTLDAGFRGRVGYEVGLADLVLVSVALDSDFERQVIVAPVVELATWSMVILPSVSFGVGVPIRVTDHVDHPRAVGIRLESSATFYSVAFVATIDVWPSDGSYAVSLLGRVGL